MYKNVALAAALAFSILLVGFSATSDIDDGYTYVEYQVKGGDTLWEICEKMNENTDDDIRNAIALTENKNDLKYDRQTLHAGDKILVAVKK